MKHYLHTFSILLMKSNPANADMSTTLWIKIVSGHCKKTLKYQT